MAYNATPAPEAPPPSYLLNQFNLPIIATSY